MIQHALSLMMFMLMEDILVQEQLGLLSVRNTTVTQDISLINLKEFAKRTLAQNISLLQDTSNLAYWPWFLS